MAVLAVSALTALPARVVSGRRVHSTKRVTRVMAKAEKKATEPEAEPVVEVTPEATPEAATPASAPLAVPDWVPEQAKPVIDFLVADDFKLSDFGPYNTYLAKYVESPLFQESVGFKPTAETLNGRLAMLGFLAGASAEVFGAGDLLAQLAGASPIVTAIFLAVTVGTMYPLYKGASGDYIESLKDTYTVPKEVFTETNEKFHGRLAMVGVSVMLIVELIKGSALL